MIAVIRYTHLYFPLIWSAIVFGMRLSGTSGICVEVMTRGPVSSDKDSHLADGICKNFIAMDCIVR